MISALFVLRENPGVESQLDPQLRAKLLKEVRTPWRGLRIALWIALLGSSFIGLVIMTLRGLAGDNVPLNDSLIQVCAVLIFSLLLFFDRSRSE